MRFIYVDSSKILYAKFVFIYPMDFSMVLQTKEQWTDVFVSIHIPADIASAYADKFILNHITELNFPDFTKDDLQELGIITLGDIKKHLM